MQPNQEQVLSLIRTLLKVGGTVLAAYGYGNDATWEAIGAVILLTPVIWDMVVHTHASAVATVGRLATDPASPVQAVIVSPTQAGDDLVKQTANPLVATAGSAAAISLSK